MKQVMGRKALWLPARNLSCCLRATLGDRVGVARGGCEQSSFK
jgi:hypothetical protein